MESSLYLPVKHFLEKLGFEVKGEVRGCDVVGLREGEPPAVVIGELKLHFHARPRIASRQSDAGVRRSLARRPCLAAWPGP